MSQTERVAVRQPGRVCAHDGCDTVLSIYNPAKYCSAHATEALNRRGRGSPHASRRSVCEQCGEDFETRNPRRRYCSDGCRMAAFARRKRAADREERRLRKQSQERTERREPQSVADAA